MQVLRDNIDGVFNELEPLLKEICEMYMTLDQKLKEAGRPGILEWPGKDREFLIRLLVDGTPMNTSFTDQATLAELNLVNAIPLIHSPKHQHLLFSCNLPENHRLLRHYFETKFVPEMEQIEEREFEFAGVGKCTIKLMLVCADQKQLAYMAGESCNSSTYFTTHTEVSRKQIRDLKEMFEVFFSPYTYEIRLKFAERRDRWLKENAHRYSSHENLLKKCNEKMAEWGSRQLYAPPIGFYILRAYLDPLHCANLCAEHEWVSTLQTVIWLTSPKVKGMSLDKQPFTSPIRIFLDGVRALTFHGNQALITKSEKYYEDDATRFR